MYSNANSKHLAVTKSVNAPICKQTNRKRITKPKPFYSFLQKIRINRETPFHFNYLLYFVFEYIHLI